MSANSRRAVWRGIAVAALAAACVDGPTAPGRFGVLRLRPAFDAADRPEALGVRVDSAAVRVTRPAEPDAPVIDTRVPYESDTASFGWIVDLRAATESLRVEMTLWGGGTRFYDGGRLVEVRDSALAAAAAPVDLGYVGPPIVDAVTVAPADTLAALGATATLVGVARDRDGAVVGGVPFSWASADGAVVTVDPASGVVTATGNGSALVTATTGAVSGATTVVVRQRVATVTITPPAATLTALGATQTLAAQINDANGFAVAGETVVWASEDPGIASVDVATGVVTALAGGHATIRATSAGVTATADVTVNPIADVVSIVVSPPSATLGAVDATRQFAAEARDALGNVIAGVQFTWTSSAPGVATIDAATGLARAVGHGATTVTAGAGAVAGNATLNVDLSATIVAVVVTPPAALLTALGATHQFTAEARDAGGNAVPVAAFSWTSAQPAVAGVDATGLATAASHGVTAIRATVAGVTGEATLDVDLSTTVVAVHVSPATATLSGPGQTRQFSAVARDGAGQVVPGVPFDWTSSVPDVATIDPATGLATATGHGSTTVTAAVGGIAGHATLAVNLEPSVASVAVSPAAATLTVVAATRQFTAVARDAQGTVLPGIPFTWSSSVPAVATVTSSGLATAAAHGATAITATAGPAAGSAELIVDLAATIATVHVAPAAAELSARGDSQQSTAAARDAAGLPVPVVAFAWSSGTPAVASIDPASGLATAVGHGTAIVTATAGGVSGNATLAVNLTPSVVHVVVMPHSAALDALGATQPFTAEARDGAGQVLPGVPFRWTSSAPAVATIDSISGVASATGQGTTSITATAGVGQGSAVLTVDLAPQVASLEVAPDTATLTGLGTMQPFTVIARDVNGTVLPGVAPLWASSAPAVATIDAATGLATAAGHGAAVITATLGAVSGSALLTVDLSTTIVSVGVSPSTATVTAVGATQQFTAVARDAGGAVVPVASFAWSSAAAGVATVDATGLATATGHGTAAIAATVGGVTGEAMLTVDLTGVVATVTVTPSYVKLTSLGATQTFTAEARDAAGALVAGVSFVWTSSEPGVATIDTATGVASAVTNGYTTITASVGAVSGTATLKVYQKIAGVVVTPAVATLIGKSTPQQFTAQAFDANGHVVAGATFSWSSSNTSVAKVDATGLATPCGYGATTIKATAGYVAGYASLTVKRPY